MTTITATITREAAIDLAVRSIAIMADGELSDFEEVVHPDAVNREAVDEPLASRGTGPAAFHATAVWLREAFSELHWDVHDVVVDGDLVVVHCTMSGCHTGPMVAFDERASITAVMPATGRRFSSTQSHWLRIADGQVIEHWANRDDRATAVQLGWAPPSPRYLVRMGLARRRARRSTRRA